MQPVNTVEFIAKDKRTENIQIDGYHIQSSKVYNIVPTNQKNISSAVHKGSINNNNNNNGQRIQTLSAMNSVQRGTVSVTGGNPLKVHVVNSKSNLTMKTPLQVNRKKKVFLLLYTSLFAPMCPIFFLLLI